MSNYLKFFCLIFLPAFSVSQRFLPLIIQSLQLSPMTDEFLVQSQLGFILSVAKLEMSFVSNSSEAGKTNFKVILDSGESPDKSPDFIKATLISNNTQVQFRSSYLLESCYSLSFPFTIGYHVSEEVSGISSNYLEILVSCSDGSTDGEMPGSEGSSFWLVVFSVILILSSFVGLGFWYSKKRKEIGYTMNKFEFQPEEEKISEIGSTDRKMQDEIANYNNKLLKRKRKSRAKGGSASGDNSLEEDNNKSLDFPPLDNKDDSEKMMNMKELADLSNIHNTTVFKPDLSMSYSIVNEIMDNKSSQVSSNRPIIEELNDE